VNKRSSLQDLKRGKETRVKLKFLARSRSITWVFYLSPTSMTDTKACVDCDSLQEGSPDLQVRDSKADLLNPATFIAPNVSSESPRVVIQFCDRVGS
jgi:hypothetical protein